MYFVFIHTIVQTKEIPFSISLSSNFSQEIITKRFRPLQTIPNKHFETLGLDRLQTISQPAFCDIADDLIDIFSSSTLVFANKMQFNLLKSLFKMISYKFAPNKTILNIRDIDEKLFFGNNSSHSTLLIYRHSDQYKSNAIQLLKETLSNTKQHRPIPTFTRNTDHLDLNAYKTGSGVYYMKNAEGIIVYVGKAKNIKKRLNSHFQGELKTSNIDYNTIQSIDVDYYGNDFISQLVESESIKMLQPKYNSQQKITPKPYIINIGKTAKGIKKLAIVRKEHQDNLPEKYYNRNSVKEILKAFCKMFELCPKFIGIERVKGACSQSEKGYCLGVCNGNETIDEYNLRVKNALDWFKSRNENIIYKLKGRTLREDAFIYTYNGIYEGYGYVEKDTPISKIDDALDYLVPKPNNYDTARIVDGLAKRIRPDNVFKF